MISSTYFFFWLIMGSISAYLAKKRGKNPLLWFILGTLLGVLGLFILFFMPKKKERAPQATEPSNEVTIDVTPQVKPSELEKFWYYLAAGNEQNGPMSFDALKRAFREGKISDATYVWNEEMEGWKRFGELFTPVPVVPE